MSVSDQPARKYYLDDLEAGMRFEAGPYTVTEDEIIKFARQFDPQPFHTDPEAAKDTMFQGLAASGWHTAAITMRLLVDGAAPFGDGAIGLGCELSWPRPVRPGDALKAVSEIVDVTPSRSKPNQGIVTVRTVTSNQNDEPVQISTSKILAYKSCVRQVLQND